MPLTFGCHDRAMKRDGKLDYQSEAMAAMKLAATTSGFERMAWVRVAQAWHEMAQWREHRESEAPATCTERE